MGKIIVHDADLERTTDLAVGRVEIVTDDSRPDRVEIYLLDAAGDRAEGGTFDLNLFMNKVIEFYNEHF
jgi:metal-dependent HD superfamily phosphatase/phosphodiesterase